MEPISLDQIGNLNFAGTAGEQISLDKAIAWTATYQENHAGGLKSVFFSTTVFKQLFSQQGATGIRIYNATDSEGKDCFVLVGATQDGDLTEGQSIVFDKGNCCPDTCINSLLNHG